MRRLARAVVVVFAVSLAMTTFTLAGATPKKKVTCKRLLKPAEVAAVVGAPVTFQKPFETATQIGCHWVNAADEVNLSVYFDGGRQFLFTKNHPPGGYPMEAVKGVGAEAFVVRLPSGHIGDLWVLTKKVSFDINNSNLHKKPAEVLTEVVALAKKVTKRTG